jgi:hypothetical protein
LTSSAPCAIINTERNERNDIMRSKWIFQNRECGNILTYDEMIEEYREMYDGDDPTNPYGWDTYYELIDW